MKDKHQTGLFRTLRQNNISAAALKLIMACCMISAHGFCKAKAEKPVVIDNPLKEEMALLQNAYNTVINVLLLGGDPETIVHDFHAVHEAKHKTEMALEKKEIQLPKNADQLKRFLKLDSEFHEQIEKVVEAAQNKDIPGLRKLSGKMLDGCIDCHDSFRN